MADIVGLIKKHINARLRELQTVEVVIVEAVDLTTWTCSVRPKAKVNVQGVVQDMPIIMEVPISLPKSGNSVVMLPPKVGDVCLCVFSKHALDNMLIDDNTVSITIPRNYDINDCLLLSGLYTEIENVPSISEGELLVYHHSGSYIKFDNGGNLEIKAKRIDFTEM